MKTKNASCKTAQSLRVVHVRGKALLTPCQLPNGAEAEAAELDDVIYGVQTEYYEVFKKRFAFCIGYNGGTLVLAEHDKVAPISHVDALRWIAQVEALVSEVFSQNGEVDVILGNGSGLIQWHSELASRLESASK